MDAQAGRAILVVEDEYLIAEEVSQQVRALGTGPVFVASSVADGMTVARERTIGLAILDINLKNELVFPLAAELSARQVPIIFHTSMPLENIPEPWSKYPILQKPMDPSKLVPLLAGFGLAGQPN